MEVKRLIYETPIITFVTYTDVIAASALVEWPDGWTED